MSATVTTPHLPTFAAAGAAGAVGRRVRRRDAATFRRRRAVVGAVAAALIACTTVLAHDVLAGSGGVPASAASSQPALVRTSIIARQGDTLWSIASTHRGGVPITDFVDKLVTLNGGASIDAGQLVVLP